MKIPIANIQHTGWRRAAMICVALPIGTAMLAPEIVGAIGECFAEAWDGFTNECWRQFHDARGARLLRAAWEQMWSAEWVAK